ncbi:hypothetical protein [Novosphingobium aerophilum]|uniref:Uncharacterized protein n=1 Tax=Novosphingobium aerophilum TaxID=2839843 RepID=A0A7X1F799_9SPHN|nr:hypothetical protein [Novosphingobium aerophilum]MBC2651359.1 hypothetical protein [Novosphingobium aerophilum]
MTQKSKTPAGTGASRVRLDGWTHSLDNLAASRVQFLIAAYNVRPELAAMIAVLAFEGHGHG